jgi:hypothetical protein
MHVSVVARIIPNGIFIISSLKLSILMDVRAFYRFYIG